MSSTQFAHPVERGIARVFDEHGIERQYEPHTFVLERLSDGTVHEAFTRTSSSPISASTSSAR